MNSVGDGGNPMATDDAQYESQDVRAIRGTEARTIAKWNKDGWELVTQSQGSLLQTKLTLPPPETEDAVAPIGGVWRLDPTPRDRQYDHGRDPGRRRQPRVDQGTGRSRGRAERTPLRRTNDGTGRVEPAAEKYTYQGPRDQIVAVDENVGITGLNTYWVYTSRFNYSTVAFKDQVKMIITDIVNTMRIRPSSWCRLSPTKR